MEDINNRKFVGRLIYSVLTDRRSVLDAIKLFPKSKDKSIECAYHALVHYAADDEIRYKDIDYRDAQDEYLESIAQTLSEGKVLPKNIIEEYKPFYTGTAQVWHKGFQGFIEEFLRFINLS